jgi:hypothetical protein
VHMQCPHTRTHACHVRENPHRRLLTQGHRLQIVVCRPLLHVHNAFAQQGFVTLPAVPWPARLPPPPEGTRPNPTQFTPPFQWDTAGQERFLNSSPAATTAARTASSWSAAAVLGFHNAHAHVAGRNISIKSVPPIHTSMYTPNQVVYDVVDFQDSSFNNEAVAERDRLGACVCVLLGRGSADVGMAHAV